MKKKNWLFWLPIGAAAVWAGSHLLPFGHMGHGGGHGMMGHGGPHGFGFGWTKVLIGAGMALFGVSLRKHAADTWKKWAGYGLIAAGFITVFKPLLPVLAIGAGAYWLFKKAGSSKEEFGTVDYTVPANSNAAALDTWEQSISKEEK